MVAGLQVICKVLHRLRGHRGKGCREKVSSQQSPIAAGGAELSYESCWQRQIDGIWQLNVSGHLSGARRDNRWPANDDATV